MSEKREMLSGRELENWWEQKVESIPRDQKEVGSSGPALALVALSASVPPPAARGYNNSGSQHVLTTISHRPSGGAGKDRVSGVSGAATKSHRTSPWACVECHVLMRGRYNHNPPQPCVLLFLLEWWKLT